MCGPVAAKQVTDREQGIPYIEFSSEDDRLEALLNGDINASLVDHAYAVEKLAEYEGRLAAVGPSVLLDRGIGMGVREDSTDLRDKLNEAIASMKADGSLNELIRKWVGEKARTSSGSRQPLPTPLNRGHLLPPPSSQSFALPPMYTPYVGRRHTARPPAASIPSSPATPRPRM